ncbi:MAG: hypothetical protein ACXVP4_08530 [Bacteroidia bacterium]
MFKYIFILLLLIIILISWSNYYIIKTTHSQIYSEITEIPKNDVAILLGASKSLKNGNDNLFFKYRIEAAAQLFTQLIYDSLANKRTALNFFAHSLAH